MNSLYIYLNAYRYYDTFIINWIIFLKTQCCKIKLFIKLIVSNKIHYYMYVTGKMENSDHVYNVRGILCNVNCEVLYIIRIFHFSRNIYIYIYMYITFSNTVLFLYRSMKKKFVIAKVSKIKFHKIILLRV